MCQVGAKGTTITDRAGSGAGNQVRKILAGLLGVCQPAGLASEATIRLDHKPGEKVQVDFSDGVWLTDSTTGKKTLTEFFLGVLPFSSHVFGEFVLDQKLPTFVRLDERMLPISAE